MSVLSINGMDNISSVAAMLDGNTGADFSGSVGTIDYLPAGGLMGGGALSFSSETAKIYNTAGFGATISVGVMYSFFMPTAVRNTTLAQVVNNTDASWNASSGNSACRIMVTTAGAVEWWTGGAFREVLFSDGTIEPDQFYYLCAWLVPSTTTTFKCFLKINNVLVESSAYSHSSMNTRFLQVFGGSGGAVVYDDICRITADLTSLPPQAIYSQTASADRVAQGFLFTGAASANAAIAELPPDDTASYIYAGTPGNRSEFELANLPAWVDQVTALRITTRAARDNAGGNVNTQSSLHLASGTQVSAQENLLVDNSWVTYKGGTLTQNPDTAASWTPAEVDGLYIASEVIV
ncbi:hypothetical protein AN401_07290 [Zobellella denitrificans]|uniref:Uncharacterized protein n=1 Tax=Zobellella denitrificans TaxID=347534 RepID=A0A291HNE7_9GAMM|nr:hypothetical protein [Zobellella denitrificans]ATG73687.1 hypothetical protein AN401_07290 [Zobellella denitrificans]